MERARRGAAVAVVGLALAVAAPAAGPPPARTRVESVFLRAGDAPAVEVILSSAVEPVVRALENPARVYVDLKNTTLAPTVVRVLEGAGAVRRVRLGQFDPHTVRVVAELAAPVVADVEQAGRTMRLVFAAAPPTSEPPAVLPAAAAPASRPATAIEERIGRRYAAEDWPGIVALYARNAKVVRRGVDAGTRAAVVDALRELGLMSSARKLLGPPAPGEAPALRVARAELAVTAGDAGGAAALVEGLDERAVDASLVPKLRRARVRVALARGDLAGAAVGIGTRAIPELRAELAGAAIMAGRTALERQACPRALAAFRQGLEADGGRTARSASAAGLVRAALACGDAEATATGLGVLAESPHPLLRRAAAVLASTRSNDGPIARRGG